VQTRDGIEIEVLEVLAEEPGRFEEGNVGVSKWDFNGKWD